MTAKRFILTAICLKMTAKLTDFAVNYKISESGNLTNNDFFNLLMRWNRKRRKKTVQVFTGCSSFRAIIGCLQFVRFRKSVRGKWHICSIVHNYQTIYGLSGRLHQAWLQICLIFPPFFIKVTEKFSFLQPLLIRPKKWLQNRFVLMPNFSLQSSKWRQN